MAEYISIHKCRMCGKMVEGGRTGRIVATREIVKIAITGKSDLVQGPAMIEPHICDDGNLGLADFQGFRKVGAD